MKRRALGQHFLTDGGAIERILAALSLRAGEVALEIGPGRGALTGRLVRRGARLAVVEKDAGLAAALAARFAPSELCVIAGDALELKLSDVLARLERPGGRLVVVGNLPYSISKPVVQKLVAEHRSVERAVLMFQREVARRLTAGPGSRDYGPLGVLAGQVFEIRALLDLPPRAFRPAPQVWSTVTLWFPRPGAEAFCAQEEARLRACLSACFARRRQVLRNNLRAALGDGALAERLLAAANVDGRCRAEQLAPEAFLRLCAAWPLV
jgi:16S rRNA (adenine1518-N6/adenine1519-N6)-dimethyltransferase